jgi:hypothetical protein
MGFSFRLGVERNKSTPSKKARLRGQGNNAANGDLATFAEKKKMRNCEDAR